MTKITTLLRGFSTLALKNSLTKPVAALSDKLPSEPTVAPMTPLNTPLSKALRAAWQEQKRLTNAPELPHSLIEIIVDDDGTRANDYPFPESEKNEQRAA